MKNNISPRILARLAVLNVAANVLAMNKALEDMDFENIDYEKLLDFEAIADSMMGNLNKAFDELEKQKLRN